MNIVFIIEVKNFMLMKWSYGSPPFMLMVEPIMVIMI